MIQKDGQGDEYHTTVTVFEPDKYRDGEEFDYAEYLATQQSNTELEIKKESPKTETAISQTQATVSEMELSGTNVAQKQSDVKPKFSLSKAVEETKDLIAVHNLHVAELLETLKLSGLPSPSVAIIKAETGHDKYGDVSLILPKNAIDPQANKANKI